MLFFRLKFLLSLAFIFLSLFLIADNTDSLQPALHTPYSILHTNKNFLAEAKIHYGFIMRHHKNMANMTNIHLSAFEFSISKQTDGNEIWHNAYAYPQYGISFWYSSLNNSEILGRAYAINPYINFPLFAKHSFRLSYRFGVGLGWLSKRFDTRNNYRNIAISSRINSTIRMNLQSDFTFGNIVISPGLGMTHFSNGNVKKPNLGINIVTANLGLTYTFGKLKYDNLIRKNMPKLTNSSDLTLIANIGTKAINKLGWNDYFVYNFELSYLRKVSYKSRFGAGIDLFYDIAESVILQNSGENISHNWQVIKPGVFAAYQLDISKLSLNFNLGRYIYSKYKGDGYIYNRLAIRYAVSKNVFLNISLKAHFAKADVTEYGIGYKLK